MPDQTQHLEFLGMPAVACSQEMLHVLERVRRVAQSNVAVLITGETGAGKEIVARAVHHFSLRSSKPWVDVNCGALPESLIESELFGHERGAFSGAERDRSGLFEMASEGTLYLDEIAELDPRMQVRLLRVLDGAAFYRVGGRKKISVNVRLVAATNRDLEQEVHERRFRSDVFHRICQVRIHVPPLRERPADIVPLARFFLEQQKLDAELSPAAEEFLQTKEWPGNARQLRNTVVQAALLNDGRIIHPEQLTLTETAEGLGLLQIPGSLAPLENMEKKAILQTLDHTDGNQTRAAALLGISRRTLLRRLKDYEVEEQTSLAVR